MQETACFRQVVQVQELLLACHALCHETPEHCACMLAPLVLYPLDVVGRACADGKWQNTSTMVHRPGASLA